ncbi:MAG: hypothetical protein KDB88_07900 [Flavobacteriales bacterium]|nr:hypothetical protein [Flavobacteriales bacterium]
MTYAYERKDRNAGVIGTIVVHALLILLFLFFGLTQPVPLPEETGVEIAMADYGTSDVGSGSVETPDPGPQESASASPASSDDPEVPEEVATQEDSPVEQVKPKETKPKPTTKHEENVKEEEKPREVSDRLSNALNSWGSGGGNSGDGQDDAPGNVGDPGGKPDGVGTFHGNGWSASLGGRGLLKGPNISDKPVESGKVVLNIFVDRLGKVVRVTQNLDKSTTTSQVLFNIAKKAALQCSFNAKPDAAAEQRGEMTFVFILE